MFVLSYISYVKYIMKDHLLFIFIQKNIFIIDLTFSTSDSAKAFDTHNTFMQLVYEQKTISQAQIITFISLKTLIITFQNCLMFCSVQDKLDVESPKAVLLFLSRLTLCHPYVNWSHLMSFIPPK